jgi:hypothetical protein
LSERGSSELAWRIIRLRFERKSGAWQAVGLCNGRVATIFLPPTFEGESADRWLERIDQAFEREGWAAS